MELEPPFNIYPTCLHFKACDLQQYINDLLFVWFSLMHFVTFLLHKIHHPNEFNATDFPHSVQQKGRIDDETALSILTFTNKTYNLIYAKYGIRIAMTNVRE